MGITKFRWSRVYESSEEELISLLTNRGLAATRIIGEAASQELQQTAPRDTTLWCAEGSCTIATGTSSVSLQPGDGVRINSQTAYDITAGISGYVYYLQAAEL